MARGGRNCLVSGDQANNVQYLSVD